MLSIETNILVKTSAGQDTVLEEAFSGEKPKWLFTGNLAAIAALRIAPVNRGCCCSG